jgi:hypothetical protein
MIFPYVRHLVERSSAIPSGEVARPEIGIRIIGPSNIVEVNGLIDTGADQVFLALPLAKMLGVEIHADELEGAESAGGQQMKMWPGKVELEIVDDGHSYRWLIEAGFIEGEDYLAPVYLGHVGFLENFQTTFDGDAQTVELIANRRFEIIARVFNHE